MINTHHFKRHLLVILLFVALLVAVEMQIGRFDSKELSHTSMVIDSLARFDVESVQEMMSIFTHNTNSYKRLHNLAVEFHQEQQQLSTILFEDINETDESIFVNNKVSEILAENLKNTQASINIQLTAIKDFTSAMVVLSQAQRAFPDLVMEATKQHPDQTQPITSLASNLTQWQLFPNAELKQKVQQQLKQIRALELHDLDAVSNTILRYRALVQEAIKTAEQCGTAENLSLIRESYEQHYSNESHIHAVSKRVLATMVVALLLYLILLLIGTHRKNLHLKQILDEKAALQEHNRLLLAAMKFAPNGILVCNRDGIILYANLRLAHMHDKQDATPLMGRYAAELRGGKPNDSIFQEIVATINSGKSWSGDYTLGSDASSLITISRTMSSIDLDGHRYLVGIDHDVTQEREQASKLEAIQRLESLGVLAGGIAHDFNNILTAIRGNAVLASRNSTKKSAPYLQRIEEGTQRAADLCQQMLAYAGKGQFVIEPLNLTTLVHDVSQLIAISIDKRIKLTVELATDLPPIEGDRAQLQQIVLNLITNANEAISGQGSLADGVITITTTECNADALMLSRALCGSDISPGPFVALQVSDNGCGMDESTIHRMFEPFFTTKFTGRGLGMSAILGIVQNHHGALLLESELGKGSRFCLLLPPTDKALPKEENVITPQKNAPLSGLILIIDDEEVIREMSAEVLDEIGLRTISAEDGEQGIIMFRQHQSEVDAVLLDMTMPKMDGEHCFKALRAIRKDLPVVVASGYAKQNATQAFGENALAGFLQKPFNPERLQQMMQKIVIASRQP